MNDQDRTKEELINELMELRQAHSSLKTKIVAECPDDSVNRQTEQELRLKKIVFDSSIAANSIADSHGVLTEVNNTFLKIWRYESKEMVVGRPISEFFQNQDEAVAIITALNTIYVWEGEFSAIRMDGSVFIAHGMATIIRDLQGNLIGYHSAVIDITERKETEKKLLDSELHFRSAFDKSPVGGLIVGLDKYLVKCNEAFCQFIGYSSEELIGKTIADITYPEDRDLGMLDLKLMAEGKIETATIQKRYVHKDGPIVWGEISIKMVRDSHNKPLYFLPVIKDITESKRALEAIQIEKGNKDAIFESSPVAMFVIDESTNIVMTNLAFTVMCGGSEEEILQHRPGEALRCIHSHIDPRGCGYAPTCKFCNVRNGVEGLIANGGSLHGAELELELTRNGELGKYWMNIGVEPIIMNGKGHWCIAMVDVTQRKKAEEENNLNSQLTNALLQLNQMRDSTLQEITDFTLEEAVRLTQSKIGYLAFLNEDESILNMHSWSRSAMAECAITDKPFLYPVVNTGLWGEAVRQRKAIITNDYLASNPLIKGTPQGHVKLSRHMNTPVFDGSKMVIVAGVGNKNEEYSEKDVKHLSLLMEGMWRMLERKKAEEELRKLNVELEQRVVDRTNELALANKELEAFSYSISHDLRAPLRHISGYVELLQTKFYDVLPEKGKHYLNSIAGSSHEMGTLVDNLLQFSRTGRAEMRKVEMDMNEIVNQVIKAISAENSKRTINWNLGKLPITKCDSQLLKQVWINLLSNAVKYTSTRANAKIDIGVFEENNEFIFFVRDNGVGFEMQYAQKLFGVFQRLHPTGEFEGTGIGLANVRQIISRHGGRTWAEAELDKGATFYFSLTK